MRALQQKCVVLTAMFTLFCNVCIVHLWHTCAGHPVAWLLACLALPLELHSCTSNRAERKLKSKTNVDRSSNKPATAHHTHIHTHMHRQTSTLSHARTHRQQAGRQTSTLSHTHSTHVQHSLSREKSATHAHPHDRSRLTYLRDAESERAAN